MWVARDKDGCICAFENKPWRQMIDHMWLDTQWYQDYKYDGNGCVFQMNVEAFTELTWDDEPIEITDAIA